uniref:Myb-like domain-containing protein n=1 Tax=Peronospora matthiolae TaxID=2874970 RepID=A0AAV1T0Y7_9STRA
MSVATSDDMSALESTAGGTETDADTIATRTRTKFSLVDVSIDTLEASLVDAAPLDLGGHAFAERGEDDQEYQRFLSSLLPNEKVDLSFLDEEDEEYRPEGDEDEDQEDDDARQGISKKELTELLLDSTRMTSLSVLPAATVEPKDVNGVVASERADDNGNEVAALSETSGEGGRKVRPAVAEPGMKTGNALVTIPAVRRGRPVTVSQTRCIQLASQMHKHLQLLLQSYHLLASQPARPELAECQAMIEDLRVRGEKALAYKNALLSKLNPGTRCSAGVASTDAVDTDVGSYNDISSPSDFSGVEGNSGDAEPTGNMLASRRVTRSLTAAHAAVAHPSMFELVGSQTVDELSAVFARGCSLGERNRAIQEQLLQLDTHLVSAKKRRKSKKGYSMIEDTLLAHGAKRFGTQATSWDQIQRHFLPSKTTQNLRHRYKYLISPKTGMNAVKALHLRTGPQHHNNSWLLEEDLRIARGLVELHGEKYPFSRLSKRYLSHRSRLEIRKRWERLATKFRLDLADMKLAVPADDSLDFVVAMKEFLEDKLRARMLQQNGKAEKAKLEAASQLHQLGQGRRDALTCGSVSNEAALGVSSLGTGTQTTGSGSISCRSKNLHPALFFSSWSFISPATLLNATCKHNWPSFMDEDSEANDNLLRKQLSTDATDNGALQTDSHHAGVNGQSVTLSKAQTYESIPSAMLSDVVVTPPAVMGLSPASVDVNAYTVQKGSEEEDDDSDYEHDELLSSDSEESGSDFEQMEFTDDDDDDVGDGNEDCEDSTEHSDLVLDVEGRSVTGTDSLEDPFWSILSSPTHDVPGLDAADGESERSQTRIRHPLRLQNLSHPENENIRRALAALEQRIVGKSISTTASLSATSSHTGCDDRPKRKVASTLVAPVGDKRTSGSHFRASMDAPTQAAGTAIADSNDCSINDDDASRDGDGSGNEEVEVVDLFSSSAQLFGDDGKKVAPEPSRTEQTRESDWSQNLARTVLCGKVCAPLCSNTPPNKKAKLQVCPICNETTCKCRSSELR